MTQKTQIRKNLLKKRRGLDESFVQHSSNLITEKFIKFVEYKSFKNILLYSDFDNEPQTEGLKEHFKNLGCRIAYPLIAGSEIIPKIPDGPMTAGKFGISEPNITDSDMELNDIDLFIVPGIGFDRLKNRIGYGKGYYDKLLCRSKALKVALAYTFQIMPMTFNTDEYDVPMDAIVTESGVI